MLTNYEPYKKRLTREIAAIRTEITATMNDLRSQAFHMIKWKRRKKQRLIETQTMKALNGGDAFYEAMLQRPTIEFVETTLLSKFYAALVVGNTKEETEYLKLLVRLVDANS